MGEVELVNDLLIKCRNDWEAMRTLREEHKRNQRYKNGHQWDDLIRPRQPYPYSMPERTSLRRKELRYRTTSFSR